MIKVGEQKARRHDGVVGWQLDPGHPLVRFPYPFATGSWAVGEQKEDGHDGVVGGRLDAGGPPTLPCHLSLFILIYVRGRL